MTFEQAPELVPLYSGIRIASLVVAIMVLSIVISRLPLWLSAPPQHIKMLGLAATLMPLTVLVNAVDQLFRAVSPGLAVFGTLITLLVVGFAVLLAPENDGRPAPFLRGLERLGVRFRASRQTRR